MFCTFTLALSAVCVQCPIWLFFCSSLISCFSGMLLRYYLSYLVMVPVAHIITNIAFAVTFHIRWIFVMRSLYFKIFSAYFYWSHFCLQLFIIIIIIIIMSISSSGSGTVPSRHYDHMTRTLYYYYYYYYCCCCCCCEQFEAQWKIYRVCSTCCESQSSQFAHTIHLRILCDLPN
jgi:hypothetical protein